MLYVHAVMGDDHHGASRVLSVHTTFSSCHRGKIHNVTADILPTHYQHDTNLTYGMQQPLQVYIAQGQELDLAHIRQSYIIHIHTDVG